MDEVGTAPGLNERLDSLEQLMGTFERRLAALEASRSTVVRDEMLQAPLLAAVPAPPEARPTPPIPEPLMVTDTPGDIALTGRSLIAVGGAYLLRALTDSSILPRTPGLVFGLAYAFLWIYIADRHAKRGRRHSAIFASIVGAVVAYPLLWEAAAHFRSFSVEVTTFLMLATSLAYLSVAAARDLGFAAWVAVLGSFGCTVALGAATEQPSLPFAAFAAGGALTWYLGSSREWAGVRWVAVAGAWAIAVPLQILVASRRTAEPPELVAAVLLIASFAYLGAIAAKNLLTRENIEWLDIIQAAGTIVCILGGTAAIASSLPGVTMAFSVAMIGVAAGTYFTAFRQPTRDARAAVYFGGVGFVFTVVATAIPFTAGITGLVWAAIALTSVLASYVLAAAAHRPGEGGELIDVSSQAVVHGALYAVVAAAASGLFRAAASAIIGIGRIVRPGPLGLAAIAVVLVTAIAAIALRGATPTTLARGSRLTLLALAAILVVAGISALAVRQFAQNPASAAAIRSAVIAAAALVVALLARVPVLSDLSMLVYPVLGLGAAKFVVDDIMTGRAVTLFIALALYGGVLVILARMRRMPAARSEQPLPIAQHPIAH